MGKRIFLSIVLAAMVSGAARAEMTGPTDRKGNWEFGFQTRYAGKQYRDGSGGSTASIEPDVGFGIGAGYNLTSNFTVGLIINWRAATYFATFVSADDPNVVEDYSNWLEVSTIGLSADWNVLSKRITPYVSGAVGWSLIDTNFPAGIAGDCGYDPWLGYVCEGRVPDYGTDGFSYSVGVGVRFEVSKSVFMRAGYEYSGIELEGTEAVDIFRFDVGFMLP